MLTWDCFTRELILLTWRSQTAWSGVVFLFVLLIMQQVRPQGRFTLKDLKKEKKGRRKEKKLAQLSVNDQVDLFSFHWPAWPEAHGSRFSPAGHTDWRSRCSPPRRWCWPHHDPTPQPPGPSSPPACAWSAGTQTHQHPPNKTLVSLA